MHALKLVPLIGDYIFPPGSYSLAQPHKGFKLDLPTSCTRGEKAKI
jgi:hypothetical protein